MSPKPNFAGRIGGKTEEFLNLFADAETCLKSRLSLPSDDETSVSRLIESYETVNPQWAEPADQLRRLARIRNLLTHQRSSVHGYPVAVMAHSLHQLRQIVDRLRNPDPVSLYFRKPVLSVGLDDSLASILALSYENGFSQFPVLDDSRFCGLVTENEIVRWLGRSTKAQRTTINLNEVPVSTVVREKDPFLRDVAVFCFARMDTPVEDVMGRFAKLRALEVVLLTPNGRSKSGIEGIVTQWDAARFPAVQNHDES